MRTLILMMALALGPACWAGEKAEPTYELAAIAEVSNFGRPIDHWFIAQTECCNYTIRNYRTFGGFTVGGNIDLSIRDDHAFIRIGKRVAKENILKVEQRGGFDRSLYVVLDPQGTEFRTRDVASLPDGWMLVAIDPEGQIYQGGNTKFQTVPVTSVAGVGSYALPAGWHLLHAIPGRALPPILRSNPR